MLPMPGRLGKPPRLVVGTLRCDVPARAQGRNKSRRCGVNHATRCAATVRRGRRSAPSLPIEQWTLTIAKINERPFFRARDQFLADRILQNVIRLFAAAFVLSQPMLKEITLPNNV